MDIKNRAFLIGGIVAIFAVAWFSYLFTSWYWQALLNGEVAKYEARLSEIDRESNRALLAQQLKRAELEQKLYTIENQQYKELNDEKLKTDQLISDLSVARKRLSVTTARCQTDSGKLPASASATRVDHDTSRAYLDAGDAANIIGIVRRGDEAIRQLTACQQYLKAVTQKD